jgi:hypothetical protein
MVGSSVAPSPSPDRWFVRSRGPSPDRSGSLIVGQENLMLRPSHVVLRLLSSVLGLAQFYDIKGKERAIGRHTDSPGPSRPSRRRLSCGRRQRTEP